MNKQLSKKQKDAEAKITADAVEESNAKAQLKTLDTLCKAHNRNSNTSLKTMVVLAIHLFQMEVVHKCRKALGMNKEVFVATHLEKYRFFQGGVDTYGDLVKHGLVVTACKALGLTSPDTKEACRILATGVRSDDDKEQRPEHLYNNGEFGNAMFEQRLRLFADGMQMDQYKNNETACAKHIVQGIKDGRKTAKSIVTNNERDRKARVADAKAKNTTASKLASIVSNWDKYIRLEDKEGNHANALQSLHNMQDLCNVLELAIMSNKDGNERLEAAIENMEDDDS